MFKSFLKHIIITIFATALNSCSDDETYDRKKAILAFSGNSSFEIDKNLKDQNIIIPEQVNVFSFEKSVAKQNQQVENYYFTPRKKGKFFSKSKEMWAGYRSFYDIRSVFSPIIIENKIFLLDGRGNLWCYGLKDKKEIFKSRIFDGKFLKTFKNPKIGYGEGKIFAITGNNQIATINSENGALLWKKEILSLPISKPIYNDGKIYIITNDNKTYALNSENGNIEWISSGINRPTAIFGSASPVVTEKMIISSYSSGEIYAYNKETGEVIWSNSLNQNRAINSDFFLNDIDATPIIKNNIVFSSSNGGLMMAINLENGNYIWKKKIATISDFWAASDFLFVIDNNNKLICIKQSNGRIKYIKQLPDYKNEDDLESKIIYNGVLMAGSKLIITNSEGVILVADPQNGKIEQKFKLGENIAHQPIIIDGKIYFHIIDWFTTSLIEIR